MPKCIRCGRETEIEGQNCSECIKQIEDEILRRRGVSKNIAGIIHEEAHAHVKPQEERRSIKSKVLMWLLIIIVLGIAIALILYLYLGILDKS